jgi:hypothetical protein
MIETVHNNKEVISNLLKPSEPQDEMKWTDFLKTVDDNILWYPSAGSDFTDLIFRFSGISVAKSPSLFIHTDYFPSEKLYKFIKTGERIHDNFLEIDLLEKIELKPTDENFVQEINYELLPYSLAVILATANRDEIVLEKLRTRNKESLLSKPFKNMREKIYSDYVTIGKKPEPELVNKIFLLHIRLPQYSHTKYLIYAFYDNVFFQRKFIVEGGLKLSNIFNSNYSIH